MSGCLGITAPCVEEALSKSAIPALHLPCMSQSHFYSSSTPTCDCHDPPPTTRSTDPLGRLDGNSWHSGVIKSNKMEILITIPDTRCW